MAISPFKVIFLSQLLKSEIACAHSALNVADRFRDTVCLAYYILHARKQALGNWRLLRHRTSTQLLYTQTYKSVILRTIKV